MFVKGGNILCFLPDKKNPLPPPNLRNSPDTKYTLIIHL